MIGEFRPLAQGGGSYRFLLWVAGEVFIVVAGVLIAFGLNAWWVERSTRVEEQTHLRALARDFERNVGLLTYLIQREEEIVTRQPRAAAARAQAARRRCRGGQSSDRRCIPVPSGRAGARRVSGPGQLRRAHVDSRRRAAKRSRRFCGAIDRSLRRAVRRRALHDVHDALHGPATLGRTPRSRRVNVAVVLGIAERSRLPGASCLPSLQRAASRGGLPAALDGKRKTSLRSCRNRSDHRVRKQPRQSSNKVSNSSVSN